MLEKITDKEQKAEICSEVLADLPEWFGIPESTAEYVCGCREIPFWTDAKNGTVRGFIALKETSAYTVEIYVMGVKKEFHRGGIGKKLFDACYRYAAEHGYEFMQVKTVREGCYEEYDRTNAFYRKQGFRELECFPSLWDACNPCQIYIRTVGETKSDLRAASDPVA